MSKFAFLAAVLLASSASAIQPVIDQPPPATPPKLLIVISVDQLSSDLFEEYRPHFTGGLARLAAGTVFRNGFQGHAASETCPGHSTILTGAHPARNGIIANNWIDQSAGRADKTIYCAEDEQVPGSTSKKYSVSAAHLKVPTLGELAKRHWRDSRNVAVGGKDRSAVMMTGKVVDQRWYWGGKNFVTDLKGVSVPDSVGRAQAAFAKAIGQPRPALELPSVCQAKAWQVQVEGGSAPVGGGRFERAAGDEDAFRVSPEFDGATLALSAAMIGDLKLGRDNAPDILAIGLAGTDYVGHRYGTRGSEMCLQLFSLDRDLGGFFTFLDGEGLDYAVALTADHGGQDIPERLRLLGVADAKRIDPALEASAMGKLIGQKLGLRGPILLGDFGGDVYVDRALKAADRRRVIAEAVTAYGAHPEIEAVFTADELQRAPMPTSTPDRWTMIERAKASYHPGRSGDLVVLLRRYVTPIVDTKSYVATHGSPWDYDRRVPILFWRKGMSSSERDQPAQTVDIMPTLAAMLRLGVDQDATDGRCLLGISGVDCPAR